MKIRHYNIPIFIPELACPHQCLFCNQRSITDQISQPTIEDVKNQISTYLNTIPQNNSSVEVAFFGGSFTGIPISLLHSYLGAVQPFFSDSCLSGIRISTRPDYINIDILKILKSYGVKAIELGAQSMDNEVLLASSRGHTVEDVEKASLLINDFGFELGLQMMVGLPKDNKSKAIETAEKIINLKAKTTRIYPCLVIKDTALETLFRKGEYRAISIENAVDISKILLQKFENSGVKVLRVGLHQSEALIEGDSLVAGPFHKSFRELVESSIWRDQLLEKLKNCSGESLKVFVGKGRINSASGYRASNRAELEKSFSKVRFFEDKSLQNRDFYVDYC